jgi:hypothetical protein
MFVIIKTKEERAPNWINKLSNLKPYLEKNTGKSVSEALILESVNPQYDDRLFKKIASLEHV